MIELGKLLTPLEGVSDIACQTISCDIPTLHPHTLRLWGNGHNGFWIHAARDAVAPYRRRRPSSMPPALRPTSGAYEVIWNMRGFQMTERGARNGKTCRTGYLTQSVAWRANSGLTRDLSSVSSARPSSSQRPKSVALAAPAPLAEYRVAPDPVRPACYVPV